MQLRKHPNRTERHLVDIGQDVWPRNTKIEMCERCAWPRLRHWIARSKCNKVLFGFNFMWWNDGIWSTQTHTHTYPFEMVVCLNKMRYHMVSMPVRPNYDSTIDVFRFGIIVGWSTKPFLLNGHYICPTERQSRHTHTHTHSHFFLFFFFLNLK